MSAIISDCGRYRYRLDRPAQAGDGATAIIMVNPSTADATENDATIRKLLGFGLRYRLGKIIVGNLFAYRATDVRELMTADDPVGRDNDRHLTGIMVEADRVIFAWGAVAKQPIQLRWRWRMVDGLFRQKFKPLCFGPPLKDGHPGHPVMLPYASAPRLWDRP